MMEPIRLYSSDSESSSSSANSSSDSSITVVDLATSTDEEKEDHIAQDNGDTGTTESKKAARQSEYSSLSPDFICKRRLTNAQRHKLLAAKQKKLWPDLHLKRHPPLIPCSEDKTEPVQIKYKDVTYNDYVLNSECESAFKDYIKKNAAAHCMLASRHTRSKVSDLLMAWKGGNFIRLTTSTNGSSQLAYVVMGPEAIYEAPLIKATTVIFKRTQKEVKQTVDSLLLMNNSQNQKIIRAAVYETAGSPHDIVCRNQTDTVSRRNMRRLKPGEWLSDDIISLYICKLLAERDSAICSTNARKLRSGFFNSMFYTKLMRVGHNHPNKFGTYKYVLVKNWSDKVPGKDIFKLDKLFIPLHKKNSHWQLAVAYMQKREIILYDSLKRKINGSRQLENETCLRKLLKYVRDEHRAKKNAALPNKHDWVLRNPTQHDIPTQQNGMYAYHF